MKPPRVLALVGERDGCAMWRVMSPFAELQRQGFPAEWGYRDDARLADIVHAFDAVVLPRLHWPRDQWANGDNWMRALHNAGLAVIYEVDDDMVSTDFVRRLIAIHGKTPEQADEVQQSILRTMRMADGVTCSTQRLATRLRTLTDRPVCVVPNFIDAEWWRALLALRRPAKEHAITIGWAGGIRPDTDVEAMVEAWRRIAAEYPQVGFVVQGHQPAIVEEMIPADRLVRLPWMALEEYPLGMAGIDIGCCPLADTRFNRSKTPIKAMEYSMVGAAVVASPVVYGGLVEHGVSGYLAETAADWHGALARLVESANIRKRLAQRLRETVEREHGLVDNVWRWVDAWATIIDDYRKRSSVLVPVGAQPAIA